MQPTSAEFKTIGACLLALAIFLAGWISSERYHEPAVIASTPHAQVQLGGGAVEAARSAAPVVAETPLPPNSTATATFTAEIGGGAPVLRTGVHEQPAPVAASGAIAATTASVQPIASAASGPTPQQLAACLRWMECPATDVHGTLVREKDGTSDLVLDAGGAPIKATFDAGATAQVTKMHSWAVGPSYGSEGFGLAASYSFNAVPVVAGLDATSGQVRMFAQWRF